MKTLLLTLACSLGLSANGCELLVKAFNPQSIGNPTEDQRGKTYRGMIVVIMPDGWTWGDKEQMPSYTVIKIPGITVERARKYVAAQLDANGEIVRARLWQIRWADLPLAARNKLAAGGMTIKAGTYAGAYDYTWAQVKGYFRNLETGLDETEDL